MAESIKNQVDALTGFTDTEDAALAGWCEDGVKCLISVFSQELKEKCMTETTLSNSPETLDLDGQGEILHVTRMSADSGGYRIPCRQIPSMYGDIARDSTDLIYYATVTDPVYWITSSDDAVILNVTPTPTANQTAIVYHVGYPQVNINSSEIGNFPDEAQHLVVLYASIKALQRKMSDKSSSLPSDVPALVLPTAPADADIDFSNVGTLTAFVPPTLSTSLSSVTTLIDTEEDPELAAVKLQEVQMEITKFQAEAQNEQSRITNEIQDFQAEVAKAAQKYQAETGYDLGKYQGEVNAAIQKFGQDVANYGSKIQKHSTDYQWLASQQAKLEQEYNAGLQMLIGGGRPAPAQQQQRG